MAVLPFETPADVHYGDIRAKLETAGRPIGGNDLFIAAHARAIDATIVTANTSEFKRVRGLTVENWLAWPNLFTRRKSCLGSPWPPTHK